MYDFHAEPGSAEIDIVTGEILTVTRKDVGDGWWEGTNQSGQTGLFPLAYVEVSKFKQNSITCQPERRWFSGTRAKSFLTCFVVL